MEDRYRKTFQHAGFGMLVLDLEGRIRDFNPAASRMMGPERAEIHKRYLGDFFGERFARSLPEKLKLLDQLGHIVLEASLSGGASGGPMLLDLTQVPWEDDSQAVLVLMRELSPRENLEQELNLQRRTLEALTARRAAQKGSDRVLLLAAADGGAAIFPAPPARGTRVDGTFADECLQLFRSPELLKAVKSAMDGGRSVIGPAWFDPPPADGKEASRLPRCLRIELAPLADADGKVDRVLAIVDDRTAERLGEEEQRRRDQRAVLSLFAGALFHEFNNYLGVILSQASALRLSTPAGRLVPPAVGAILDAAQKAAGLLRRTTEAGQDPSAGWTPLSLNTPVAEAVRMLQHMLGAGVRVRMELGDAIPQVFGEATLLRSMVVALGRQAEAFMPAGGELVVRTRRVDPSGPASPTSAEITISDTGMGMDAMTRAQVIESLVPVSTSGPGDHLDLAVARAVVLQHRGRFELESAPGRGTTWKIVLPGQESRPRLTGPHPGQAKPMDDEDGAQQLAATAAQALPAAPFALHNAFDSGGRGGVARPRVLLADDEENFRDFVRTVLQQNGYDVFTAGDGLEAFEHFQEEPEKYALAILDAYMPRLGGLETYLRMQALRPDLPVIFVSGFVRGPSRQALLASCPGRAQVVLKPFTGDQILLEVGRILEAAWSKPG